MEDTIQSLQQPLTSLTVRSSCGSCCCLPLVCSLIAACSGALSSGVPIRITAAVPAASSSVAVSAAAVVTCSAPKLWYPHYCCALLQKRLRLRKQQKAEARIADIEHQLAMARQEREKAIRSLLMMMTNLMLLLVHMLVLVLVVVLLILMLLLSLVCATVVRSNASLLTHCISPHIASTHCISPHIA